MMSTNDSYTSKEWYQGDGESSYGVYNTGAGCFQFRICEKTPMLARARLAEIIGKDVEKSRFHIRKLSRQEHPKYRPKKTGSTPKKSFGTGLPISTERDTI